MKSILFNTENVRAILEGRKTVTRRVVKLPTNIYPQDNGLYTLYADGTCYENQHIKELEQYLRRPYKAGDVLYVRETWRWLPCFECGRDLRAVPCKEGKFNHTYGNTGCYAFKADIHNCGKDCFNWKPSIHMPKEAARIFLKVTGVRVERLQDICNSGSLQDHVTNIAREGLQLQAVMENYQVLIDDFKQLWNSTIEKEQLNKYGWYANPYVWVIEFERITPEQNRQAYLLSLP